MLSRSSPVFLAALALLALGCGSPHPDLPDPAEPGTWTLTIQQEGGQREAIVYIPDSWSVEQASPLFLNFHGYGGTANNHMETADLRTLAAEDGFVLVYPQGSLLEGSPHWNSSAPSEENKSDADDFGFIERLIETLSEALGIDEQRVYAAGYSNGGMMAFGLACYRGELVAAIGSVSGAMLDDIGVACTPSHPTSVIILHGTDDGVLPYDGGDGMHSVSEALDYWTGVNGIDAEPTSEAGDGVETLRFTGGLDGTEVHHHRVLEGEHVWFDDIRVGEVDANGLLWNFVSRFGRDGAL